MNSWVKSYDYSIGENDSKIKIKKTEIGIESKNSNVKKKCKRRIEKETYDCVGIGFSVFDLVVTDNLWNFPDFELEYSWSKKSFCYF